MENTFFNHLTSNYEMFFAPAGSCQMDGIVSLYNYIMTYLTAILCVVTTALIFIILIHLHGERHLKQFKKEENLEELLNWLKYLQRWTHSTVLELVWTIIPTIILIAIAIPSFILLYSLDEIVDTQSVVKIIGYQWYWKYEYPVMDVSKDDVVTFSYLSYMLPFDDLTNEKNRRLLEVDAPLVLPTNVNSKLVITAKDVLHSFAVPALGLKMDAVPGRLNQITVHIFKSGMFYGQCSELCGVNHGFMPIAVAAVDFNTFEHFLAQCAGVEAQNIEEIEKIEEITTDETDPSWVGVIIGAVTGYFFGSSLGAYLGTTYGADYGSTLGTNLDNKFGFTNQPVFGPLLSAFFAYVGFTYGASFGGWGGSFLATFIGSIYDFANNIVTDPSLSCTIAYLYGSFFGSFFWGCVWF